MYKEDDTCHHTLHSSHWHHLWESPPMITVKSNVTLSTKFSYISCNPMFHCGRIVFAALKQPILKVWGKASRAQCPLMTALWGDNSYSKEAPHEVTMGVACEMSLTWSNTFVFNMENTNIQGVKWKKCLVVIVVKTNLLGFVVIMHLGLCKQHPQSLSLIASGLDFLFRMHPHATWQQTPPEPVY